MTSLQPKDMFELVAKAFVLEAITDKPGCTTRYEDLNGKTLQDFIVAGINSSRYFVALAESAKKDPTIPIFRYNLEALQASNQHKSPKFINFGLLEIMFPVVYARLKTANPKNIIPKVIDSVKSTTNEDVRSLIDTRVLAWSTSTSPQKIDFDSNKYKDLASVWDFYLALNNDFGPSSSNFQWTEQYKNGLPILQAFFEAYTAAGEVIRTTKEVFEAQKTKYPHVSVGILADMCAAAIFLWLSFNEGPTSIV